MEHDGIEVSGSLGVHREVIGDDCDHARRDAAVPRLPRPAPDRLGPGHDPRCGDVPGGDAGRTALPKNRRHVPARRKAVLQVVRHDGAHRRGSHDPIPVRIPSESAPPRRSNPPRHAETACGTRHLDGGRAAGQGSDRSPLFIGDPGLRTVSSGHRRCRPLRRFRSGLARQRREGPGRSVGTPSRGRRAGLPAMCPESAA